MPVFVQKSFFFLFTFLVLFVGMSQVGLGQTVSTDKLDYAPGETVIITGSGFLPGETILLEIEHIEPNLPVPFHTHSPWETLADSLGNFNSTWYVDTPELNTTLLLTVGGQTSENIARTVFTDADKHDIYFKTSGLPDGTSVTVTWSGTSDNSVAFNGTTIFNSPGPTGPSQKVTTQALTSFTFSFPDILGYTLSTSVSSPFITGGKNGSTTIIATYCTTVTPTFTTVTAICSGASLSALSTTSNNGIAGTWSPALDNTTTTTYTFTPTAGQCATTATMTITVNPLPTASITGTFAACETTTLTAVSDAISPSYVWFKDNTEISGETGSTLIVTTSGNYKVKVTDGTTNCEQTSVASSVIVNELPTATISSTNDPICEQDNAEFTITGTPNAEVTYNINSNPDTIVTLSSEGTRTISYLVEIGDEDQELTLVSVKNLTTNCTQSLTENKIVKVNPLPIIGGFN